MKRSRRVAQLAVVLIGSLAGVSPARADSGYFVVQACGGGPNLSWRADVNHGGMAAYPGPPGCGDGLVGRHVGQPSGWTVPTGAAARWWFDSPAGTAIAGIALSAHFDTKDGRWQAVLSNGSQVLAGCPAGRAGCSLDYNGGFISTPLSQHIYTEVYCPAGPCPAYWQSDSAFGNVFGRSILSAASVLVRDDSVPAVAHGRGPAWTDKWIGGTQPVVFDAEDGSGIQAIRAGVDTIQVNSSSRTCDAFAPACPNWDGAQLDINTRLVGDGKHNLAVAAVDRAGNVSNLQRTIYVDNTAPAAPINVVSDVSARWTGAPTVHLAWINPPQEFAPLDGAVLEACPSGGVQGCTTRMVTGADLKSAALELPGEGLWDVRVWLRDAVGNAARDRAAAPMLLGLDTTAPTGVAFRPRDPNEPAVLRLAAKDAASGISDGDIEIRRKGDTSWRPLATTVDGGDLIATLPDGQLPDGRYELRGRARDRAGNERSTLVMTTGKPAGVTLPVRVKTRMVVGRKQHRRARTSDGRRRIRTVFVRRPLVSSGRRVRIGGRLVAPGGNPIAGVQVEVTARVEQPGTAATPVATLRTGRRGYFSYLLPAGPSRVVRFVYRGAPKVRPQSRVVHVRVAALSSMHADHRRVVTGGTVTFTGRIKTRPLPPTGKLVELQYFDRGEWRTFRTVRAAASDRRWSFTYRFTGTVGRRVYRFRTRLPRESGYPFATGHSPSVRVTVQGL